MSTAVRMAPGGFAAEAVVKGQAELVVTQISEILSVKGVTLVGPLPKDLQKSTTGRSSRPPAWITRNSALGYL